MDLGLGGKNVVVTGAGRGMGVEIALAFAREGANLVVHYYHDTLAGANETVRRARELGVQAVALPADVSRSDEVQQLFQEIRRQFDTIDVLVNNAGQILGGPLVSFSDDEWRAQIDSQLGGTFYCSREALKIMTLKGRGKIVNISSCAALGAFPGTTAYSASKAGILGLTRALAKEVAPMGINVNAVAPGFIDTPYLADFIASQGQAFLDAKVPLGRFGKMSDVAAAVLFLASQQSDYFVGAVLSPNGGLII
jgi:3-oxoacyl-[acyl-carrier protein] reductase